MSAIHVFKLVKFKMTFKTMEGKLKKYLNCGLVIMLLALQANASNYPSEYCNELIYSNSKGPLLFARVSSGCVDKVVIGLRKSSYLSNLNPDTVTAVVTGGCYTGYSNIIESRKIILGKEWHGNGHMSAPFDSTLLYPRECAFYPKSPIKIAFTALGFWDNNHGYDYRVSLDEIKQKDPLRTHDSNGEKLSLKAWEILVNLMR